MTFSANIIRETVLTLFEKQADIEPSRLTCHLLRSLIFTLCGIWDELRELRLKHSAENLR